MIRRWVGRCVIVAGMVAASGVASPTVGRRPAQDAQAFGVYVFASAVSDATAPVTTNLPEWVPVGVSYYFEVDEGRDAVARLTDELRTGRTRRNLIRLVEAPESADLLLEVVATSHGRSPDERAPVIVVRLSIPSHSYTTDFLGGTLRTPEDRRTLLLTDFDAAQEIERWIGGNRDQLEQLVRRSR